MNKLDMWYDQIKGFKQLKYNEAQELFLVAEKSESNEAIINEIINGTLYVLYNFLKDKEFIKIKGRTFDVDDIISSFCEEWIISVKNGALLKYSKFSNIINASFVNRCIEKIINEKNLYSKVNLYKNNKIMILFETFIDLRLSQDKVSYDDLVNAINKIACDNHDVLLILENYSELLILFEKIFVSCKLDKNEGLARDSKKIRQLLPLLMNAGCYDTITKLHHEEKMMDEEILKKIYYEEVLNTIDEIINYEKHENLIYERYGLYDDVKTYDRMANENGVGRDYVRDTIFRCLHRLNDSGKLKRKMSI